MIKHLVGKIKQSSMSARLYTSASTENTQLNKFETVFSFPFIKYLALFNRLKTYHIVGSGLAIPSCTILEMLNMLPNQSYLTAAYIGITGAAVLTATSLPFKNTIGFLYISEDNKQIKISSIDFWGKRVDKIIPADDWVPLFDLKPRKVDMLFLSPQLADSTKYKWFVKFGNVLNSKKIGQVLE